MSARLKIFISIFAMLLMAVFASNVQRYSTVFLQGVSIWANNVLPTILPFMILCGVATKSGGLHLLCQKERLCKRLFGTPQGTGWIYLLSLICGYPVGAKLIAEQHDKLDKATCTKLATFCTTGSPIFILGTIGNGCLNSTKCALIILASHVLASVLNGLAYKNLYPSQHNFDTGLKGEQLFSCVIESVNSILVVGALIALFHTLCTMICDLLPSWFNSEGLLATSFALGLLEMTTGCINVSKLANPFSATVLCCSLISFGGLCVILQMMTFLSVCKIKTSTIVLTKVTHCAFSTIICFVLAKLFAI